MTTELKPCPFCGSDDVQYAFLPDCDDRNYVMYNNCGATTDSIDTLPERTALEVWNMRAENDKR